MKKPNNVFASVLIIWGIIILLMGGFLSLLVILLMLESADSVVAFGVLQAMILGTVLLLGVLPLIAGIKRLRKNGAANKQAEKVAAYPQISV